MGGTEAQKMSVLTSRADRRTILVFGPGKVCAEPSPDVAEAVYSQTTAELAAKGINVGVGSTLQTALMQLTRRSQGLDFYRTGAFVNCMMHYSGTMEAAEYRQAMSKLLDVSVDLAKAEMANLPQIMATVAGVTNPQSTSLTVDPQPVAAPDAHAKENKPASKDE